jgi:hypothetical protein
LYSIVRSQSWVAFMLAAVLFFVGIVPISAAESGNRVEIRIKVGSNQMKINGEATKIQPPFQSAGNIMVPLSVFTNTKSLGAKVQLKDNKIITLTYLQHLIILTPGSKSAMIDGKKAALPVAPVSKQGVQMVPLAIIVKTFGATLATDASTKEIVIQAILSSSVDSSHAGGGLVIDTDAGKSKIGDSYFGWSMNYPTGLIQTSQSPDGDKLIFSDVKKQYFLGVFVQEAKDERTVDEKRNSIYSYFGETEKAMDKRTVSNGDTTYERIVTKDKSGFFYEYHGIQANGFFYVVVFGKTASSASELDRYSSLLESFRTSFNRSDSTLKDLTQIIEGFKTFTDQDYGLNVKLPKEWKVDDKSSYPWFYTDDAYTFLDVTSLVSGDTLDSWVKRRQLRFEQTFAPAYRKVLELKDVVWNGIPAKALKVSYSYDTETWWEEYEIYAIKGQYRYYTEVAYYDSQKSKYSNLLDIVLRTSKVDFSTVEKNFGQIADDVDNADRTAVVTKTSTKFGYSVTLPKFWTGSKINFDENKVSYTFPGGDLNIEVWDNIPSLQEFSVYADKDIQKSLSENAKLRLVENSTVPFAGTMAKKVVLEDTTNKDIIPNRTTAYYIWKDGKIYVISGGYYLANGSDFIIQSLESVYKSFTFVTP